MTTSDLDGRTLGLASVWFALVALVITGPALLGWTAIGPESMLDRDPLYRVSEALPGGPISSDVTPIVADYPRDLRFAAGLRAGRLDTWNPLVGCGAPLWAEQGGPFFPLKLPFYLVPSPSTYVLFLTLRWIATALGAYALARARGLPHVPALAAGTSFELSGIVIAQLPFGTYSPAFVLPWVLFGAERIAQRRDGRAVASAAAALGVAAHGGHPAMVLLVFAAFAMATAGHMVRAWHAPAVGGAIALGAGGAVLIGLLLGAPVLVPLAELARMGSSYKDALAGQLMWHFQLNTARMTLPITLFAPGTLGALHDQFQTLFAFAPAIGMLSLVAAAAGISAGGVGWALAPVAALGIALACAPPGLAWVRDVPGLRLILPTYAWLLVVLPLTQAAGRGVQLLQAPGGWRRFALALAGIAVAALSLLLVQDAPVQGKAFAGALRAAVAGPRGAARLLLPPACAMGVIAAAAALQRTRRAARVGAGFVALMATEQLVVFAPLCWSPPSEVLRAPAAPAVRFLQQQLAPDVGRIVGIPYLVGHPMTPLLYGVPDLRAVSALPVRRYLDYLRGVSPAAAAFVIQDVPVARSPLLDLAAVRYVIAPQPGTSVAGLAALWQQAQPPENDPQMPLVFANEQVRIYENRRALARARIVHSAVPTTAAAARQWLLDQMARPGGDGELRDTVVVEPDEAGAPPPPLQGRGGLDEWVHIVDDSDPDRLVVRAHLATAGAVVIADTYYPGWQAMVDGQPTPIFPADLLFRAVYVPAGTHDLIFRYRPTLWGWALVAFAAGALACGFVGGGRRRTDFIERRS